NRKTVVVERRSDHVVESLQRDFGREWARLSADVRRKSLLLWSPLMLNCRKPIRISGYALGGLVLAGIVWAQLGGPGTQEWSTSGGDAQRSGWIRHDSLISKASMGSGKFGFLWKFKVNNQPRQGIAFSNPMMVANAMGYRGFRSLVVLMGHSNTVFAVDNDFGRMEFEKHFDAAVPAESTAACPGGMTAAGTRIMNPDPATLAYRGPVIRSPFHSDQGE